MVIIADLIINMWLDTNNINSIINMGKIGIKQNKCTKRINEPMKKSL